MIGIVGYGRFAKTLIELLGPMKVQVLSRQTHKNTSTVTFTQNVSAFYQSVNSVFYSVPIGVFERVIQDHAPYIEHKHTLLDVLSVKLHPKQVFDTHLASSKAQIILTHPMFGPDSSQHGFEGLPIMMDQYRANDATYTYWKTQFESRGLRVISMTANEHDREAARSQGVAHFIGRLLQQYHFSQTSIATLGAQKLKEIMDQVCNDTWELYMDLQYYNPYTKSEVEKLKTAFDDLYTKTHGD